MGIRIRRMGFGLTGRGSPAPAWIDRWAKTRHGWHLKALWRKRNSWVTDFLPVERVLNGRLFEPTTPHLENLGTATRKFQIRNLSELSPLLESREILGPMLPGATLTGDHSIYVAKTDIGSLYIPALLLIEKLWLWSSDALRAILIPNSLDLLLGTPGTTDHGTEVRLDSRLASRQPSDAALRRMAWLVQSPQARLSWGSVLTNAYENRIDLLLPAASLSGWAWGVELAAGYLVCEMLSPQVQFDLSGPVPKFRIGTVLHTCPPPVAAAPRADSALDAEAEF
jgi:hypothetical protein